MTVEVLHAVVETGVYFYFKVILLISRAIHTVLYQYHFCYVESLLIY